MIDVEKLYLDSQTSEANVIAGSYQCPQYYTYYLPTGKHLH